MNIDELNNSQLILMVLLITLVVSAAVSVATLSMVYGRITTGAGETEGPAVIQQTINRIIEREIVPPITTEKKQIESGGQITLNDITNVFTKIFFGSQQVTAGIFIDQEGTLLSAEPLEKDRRYAVPRGEEKVFFTVFYRNEHYALLRPLEPYTTANYLTLENPAEKTTIGQSALLFGGFGDEVGLHSEIVSRKKEEKDGEKLLRTSVDPSQMTLPSAVFVNNRLVGFAADYSGWIPLITEEIIEKSKEERDYAEQEVPN